MKDEVVNLNERRAAKNRVAFDPCQCGSIWWVAKVVFEKSRVTGWSDVVCNECGKGADEK